MRITFILILFIFMTPCIGYADTKVVIGKGYVSGNTFRILSDSSKNVYVQGLVDGMLAAPVFGANKSEMTSFEKCTVGMTGRQLVAIMEKYLKENPAKWNKDMNIIAYWALKEGCNN